MSDSIDTQTLADLNAACKHIEWLIRYVKTTESGNAAGVVLNAREFLEIDRIKQMRVIHAQIEARKAMR